MSNELITGWEFSVQFTPRSADSSVCVWNADAKELEKTLNGREPNANALNGREPNANALNGREPTANALNGREPNANALNGRELEKSLNEEDDITAIDWSVRKGVMTET